MTLKCLNDPEWPFYAKFSLLYEQPFENLFFTYILLNLFMSCDQRRCAKRTVIPVIRRIFGIRGRTADLSQTLHRGTLTNRASISIYYYLVPDRFSADSKTRDLE